MMDMNFEDFVNSIVNVPPELERNFTLIRELDEKTKELMGRIDECMVQYEASNSLSDRERIKNETDGLFNKIDTYSEDKVRLSIQTYELIDKNIKKLVSLVTTAEPPQNEQEMIMAQPPPGFDMPPDDHEPTYCFCNRISHGEMIACENKECDIEWFHFECVGVTEAPRGKWYCGNCLPLVKADYRKSASKRRRK